MDSAKEKKTWRYVATGSIFLSIITLFLPIISYLPNNSNWTWRFNIVALLADPGMFVYAVLNDYCGTLFQSVSLSAAAALVSILVSIGTAAIIVSLIGLQTMAKQSNSARPYRMTLCGLIGTAIPALTLLTVYLMSFELFGGTIKLGAYAIVTPLAMILACVTVTRHYRLTGRQAAMAERARQYIRPAGDLPPLRKGVQNGI